MTNEKKIVVFTGIAHFSTHFFELIFPALVIPLTLSLNLELAQVLPISFLMYLMLGLGAGPWGVVSDRIGHRLCLVIFFVGSGVGSVLTSFAATPVELFLSLAVIGLFVSSYHPSGLALLSQGVKERGRAMGINGAAGSAGLAAAPLMAGLFNLLVGWRMIYLAAGIISIVIGILMALSKIDETPVPNQDVSTEETRSGEYRTTILFLAFVLIMSGLVYRMNTVILPAYLELHSPFLWNFIRSLSPAQAAGVATLAATILATIIYTVGIFGQYFGGWISDRYRLTHVYLAFTLIGIPALLAMAFLEEVGLVLASAFYVFFALGMQPVENSLVAKLTPSKYRSTGYGIKFSFTFGVGSIAVYLVGWIEGTWNLPMVYVFSSLAIFLMAAGIAAMIWQTRRWATGTP